MDSNDHANTTFSGMYFATEIDLGALVRFTRRLRSAIHSHLVMMPTSFALRQLDSPIGA